jgi:hypothetical protein
MGRSSGDKPAKAVIYGSGGWPELSEEVPADGFTKKMSVHLVHDGTCHAGPHKDGVAISAEIERESKKAKPKSRGGARVKYFSALTSEIIVDPDNIPWLIGNVALWAVRHKMKTNGPEAAPDYVGEIIREVVRGLARGADGLDSHPGDPKAMEAMEAAREGLMRGIQDGMEKWGDPYGRRQSYRENVLEAAERNGSG